MPEPLNWLIPRRKNLSSSSTVPQWWPYHTAEVQLVWLDGVGFSLQYAARCHWKCSKGDYRGSMTLPINQKSSHHPQMRLISSWSQTEVPPTAIISAVQGRITTTGKRRRHVRGECHHYLGKRLLSHETFSGGGSLITMNRFFSVNYVGIWLKDLYKMCLNNHKFLSQSHHLSERRKMRWTTSSVCPAHPCTFTPEKIPGKINSMSRCLDSISSGLCVRTKMPRAPKHSHIWDSFFLAKK